MPKLGEMSPGLRLCQNWERPVSTEAMPNWEECGSRYGHAKTGTDVTRITAMPKLGEMWLDYIYAKLGETWFDVRLS